MWDSTITINIGIKYGYGMGTVTPGGTTLLMCDGCITVL